MSNNQYIVACGKDFQTTVYDSKTGKIVKNIPQNQGVDGLVWSNTGMLPVTGEEVSADKEDQKHNYL